MANQNLYDPIMSGQKPDNSMDVANGIIGLMGKMDERRKLQAWQKQIDMTIADPSTPAQYKQILPLIRNDPGSVGQVIPALMKQQSTKPTVSIWENPQTNEVSRTPVNKPGWVEDAGLTPNQARGAANSATLSKIRTEWAGQMKQRNDLYTLNMVYNALDEVNRNSGGLLGQASTVQYRSQRAMDLLDSPGIATDKQVYGLLDADLGAIAQGGSPTVMAMAEASNPTIKQEANGLLRKITADPTTVNQPAIKMQLRRIFQVMDKSAGSIINQHTQGVQAIFQKTPYLKDNPDVMKQAMQYLGQGIKPFDVSKLPPLPPAPNDAEPSYEDTQPVEPQ